MTNASSHRVDLARIAPALIAAVLTVIFCVLPWIHIPLAEISYLLIGQDAGLKSDYSVLDMFNFVTTNIPSNPEFYDEASEASFHQGIFMVYGFMALWVVGIAVTLIGSFRLYSEGEGKLLVVGSCIAALSAVIFILVAQTIMRAIAEESYGMSVVSMTAWPYAAAAAGAISAFLAHSVQGSSTSFSPIASGGNASTAPVYGNNSNTSNRNVATSGNTQTATADVITTHCMCPTCASTVRVKVPNRNCMVNITCSNCGTKFPMEVRPRG